MARNARASGTSARTRTPGRSARRLTSCFGVSDPIVQLGGIEARRSIWASVPSGLHLQVALHRASIASRPDDHRALVDDLCAFLAGDAGRFVKDRQREMPRPPTHQEYERAARFRDDIRALERALERNTIVLPDDTDADVIAVAEDELEAAFHVFHVRGGRVRGQRGTVTEKVDDIDGRRLRSTS